MKKEEAYALLGLSAHDAETTTFVWSGKKLPKTGHSDSTKFVSRRRAVAGVTGIILIPWTYSYLSSY